MHEFYDSQRSDESNLFRRQLHNNEWILKSWDLRFIKEISMDFDWQMKQKQNSNDSKIDAPHLFVKVIKWTEDIVKNKCEFLCVVENNQRVCAVMLCCFHKTSQIQPKL